MRCIVGVGTSISAVSSETLSGRCAETTVSSTMNDLCAELCGSVGRLATGVCIMARDRRRGGLVSTEFISFRIGAMSGPLTKMGFFILTNALHDQVPRATLVREKFRPARHQAVAFSNCAPRVRVNNNQTVIAAAMTINVQCQ